MGFNTYQTSAAIIYTDIVDYSLPTGGDYYIDFNNDGSSEARLVDYFDDVNLGLLPAFMYLDFTTESAANGDQLAPIAQGTPIDANSGWFMFVDALVDSQIGGIPFPVGSDQYIGVTITDFGGVNYGWLRVYWNGFDVFEIKDFAYESNFDTPINAGDTGASASLNSPLTETTNALTLSPNPSSEQVIISSVLGGQQDGEIEIYDLSGRQIFSSAITDQVQINTSTWSNGMYQVYFKRENFIETKKLLVNH